MRPKYKDLYLKVLADREMIYSKYNLLVKLLKRTCECEGDINEALKEFTEREQNLLNYILDVVGWD